MEDKVDDGTYSTDNITNVKLPPPREKSRLIPIWTFIKERQSSDEAEEESAPLTRSRLYLVGLGIFAALVAVTLIYMSVKTAIMAGNISDLTTKRKQLLGETKKMEGQISMLNLEIDKKCGPCPSDWIHFKQKCYMFYNQPPPWKTWEQSEFFCHERLARLVIIRDLEEQKFVNQHIKYYNSRYNGYWMGLQYINSNWTWIDGRVDTLGFWMKKVFEGPQERALLIPGQNPSESWSRESQLLLNKLICERYVRLASPI